VLWGVVATAQSGTNVFRAQDFGALADGSTEDTRALQNALDACNRSGGGTVLLGAGTYLTGPLFLSSDTTLELKAGATLVGTRVLEQYHRPDKTFPATSSSAFYPLLSAKRATNVAIVGGGTIDGSGSAWWEAARIAKETNPTNSGYTLPRPRLIQFEDCKTVRMEGVTLVNSPSFHLVPKRCEDVVIEGLTITAPDEAPNTDGIDPSECINVHIANCVIDVGDDNIAIKSGNRAENREFACENITITDCVFKRGHGLSIGSETEGGVRNLLVERCRFEGTENGLRIKSKRGQGGQIEQLVYRDIEMVNVDPAITFTCYYPKIPSRDDAKPITDETPRYRHLTVSNLTATCPKEAGVIVGLPESPIKHLVLKNVKIEAATGLMLRNVKGVEVEGVELTVREGTPFIVEDAEVKDLPAATRQP
jgi:polygalacturonase